MRRRIMTAALAALLMLSSLPVSAEDLPQVNADGYDISGFAWQFPEVFAKDDTVTVTDTSYQSHDVSVNITRHAYDRMTGDVDENGEVTVGDAVQLSRILGEDPTVDVSQLGLSNADIDEDSTFGLNDLTMMLEYLAGLRADDDFFVDHSLVYFVTDVYIRNIENFRGAFAGGQYTLPDNAITAEVVDMAKENDAIFAINCDYVAHRTNGITYRNGVMYREDASTYKKDVCIIWKDGRMEILTDAEYRLLTDEQKAEIWHTSSFAPALVKDGEVRSGFKGQLAIQHPRSGIGYYAPGHYVFLQVEGRQKGYSVGVTLDEYAAMFGELGVSQAWNMDGGSSSVIAFMGKEANKPAWSGRESSDILYICEAPAE